MLRKPQLFIALFFFLSISETTLAVDAAVKIKLKDLLKASSEISNSLPSPLVNAKVAGQKIKINDENYEVRYFSFEDTLKSLQNDTTFEEYATKNNLLDHDSVASTPLPGIDFQCFDFRFSNLNDGVYFSMAIRKIEDK